MADSGTAQITASDLVVVSDNAKADGNATNSVQARVTDANGNPVPNVVVSFSADNGATVAGSGTTAADGTVTVTLTNTTAGAATVTAAINGGSQQVVTNFVAGPVSLAMSTITATPTNIFVGGDVSKIEINLRDMYSNPVTGATIAATANLGTLSTVTETTSGTYILTLTSTDKVGTSTIKADTDDGVQLLQKVIILPRMVPTDPNFYLDKCTVASDRLITILEASNPLGLSSTRDVLGISYTVTVRYNNNVHDPQTVTGDLPVQGLPGDRLGVQYTIKYASIGADWTGSVTVNFAIRLPDTTYTVTRECIK